MQAITVENLSKTFRVKRKEKGMRGSIKAILHPQTEEIQAVKGVTFAVEEAEMMFFGSNAASVAGEAARDIRGGIIAYLMNRPYHYTLYVLSRYSGEWSVRLPMYALLSAAAVAVFYRGLKRYASGNLMEARL